MRLADRLRGRSEQRYTLDDYAALVSEFSYAGIGYTALGGPPVQQTLAGSQAESIGRDFGGLAGQFGANGVVFSCMLVRQLAFSSIRFQYQRILNGRPSELFGDQSLALLEQPWPGGTTQDLLARMLQDADLAGNSFWTVEGSEVVRLRPDWVGIVYGERRSGLGQQRLGYVYVEGGFGSGGRERVLLPEQVAHFAPIPDPMASFRGMSWLTPVIREITGDGLMNQHKRRFFENGATPNMVVKHAPNVTPDQVRRFKAALDSEHQGVTNAYKTLHVGGGADVTVVGADFKQLDFKAVQGHGETRIAAAAGVPPVIVGLSEGLAAATYSNYAQARRRFGDGTMHPLWQNAAGSLARIMPRQAQPGVRLWYDARDVPFLREDEKDAAEIQEMQARTIRTLVDGGYTPESVQRAVMSGDYGLLEHSGFLSVQLQRPGTDVPALTTGDTDG